MNPLFISDIARNPDFTVGENKGIPLLLILGYSNGVQIWNVMVGFKLLYLSLIYTVKPVLRGHLWDEEKMAL